MPQKTLNKMHNFSMQVEVSILPGSARFRIFNHTVKYSTAVEGRRVVSALRQSD